MSVREIYSWITMMTIFNLTKNLMIRHLRCWIEMIFCATMQVLILIQFPRDNNNYRRCGRCYILCVYFATIIIKRNIAIIAKCPTHFFFFVVHFFVMAINSRRCVLSGNLLLIAFVMYH